MNLLLVALGGAFGSVARYGVAAILHRPYAIFYINVFGSFLLGLIMVFLMRHVQESKSMQLLLGVGFCGGFTTFSTFSMEAWEMFAADKFTQAFTYIGASVVCSILGFGLGAYLAKTI
jgi:CrcB protein